MTGRPPARPEKKNKIDGLKRRLRDHGERRGEGIMEPHVRFFDSILDKEATN